MPRVRVKICGNTKREDVEHAIQMGADAVGFIVGFPSSPRNLYIERAADLMKELPPLVDRVVVTRQDDMNLLRKIAEKLQADAVQLIGEKPYTSELRQIFKNTRLIKVVHAASYGFAVEPAIEASKYYDAVLVDSGMQGVPGGTGQVHDWDISRKVADLIRPRPLILAGGLNPSNVDAAIRAVKPYGVDVSSGVESAPGIKDHHKVERFIENALKVRV
jgi:phosphoribosylanthranilate isomerase